MSEPVGNANRSASPLPGSNSHATRAAAAEKAAPPETREKIEKVITGKVVQRKPNALKRFARGMVAEDVTNVGDFVIAEVMLPAFRNLVYDIISKGSYRVLYGHSPRGRVGSATSVAIGPMTSLKTAYNHVSSQPEPARSMTRQDQASHNFSELYLDSQAEAVDVIENLIARVNRYGSASVADLYDYLGVTGGFTDQAYGWKNLDGADTRHTRHGWSLVLPRPISLSR